MMSGAASSRLEQCRGFIRFMAPIPSGRTELLRNVIVKKNMGIMSVF